jgi:glycosyltransferase involved in cell wall biosynthesis
MWGHSWKEVEKNKNNDQNNDQNNDKNIFIENLYLSDFIKPFFSKNNDINLLLKQNVCYNVNKNIKNIENICKKKIVHIMGLFFTGGIERYLYYIDKYGDHTKYSYYLIHLNNGKYVYDIKNIEMISYSGNNYHLYINKIFHYINPDLIIDHYSIYIPDNSLLYENINRDNILYFVHSAICYNNDISKLYIKKSINLYNELSKDKSWDNIKNYYLTLGIELQKKTKGKEKDKEEQKQKKLDKKLNKNTDLKLKISIIGRITEEKLPIIFFEKLCILSNKIKDIEIHIYGEKDKIFNNDYVIKFEKLFEKLKDNSSIILHDFVDPLKIKDIYENTNLLLIPSIYETGSFTCLEAFSYGIPVISRNVYGLKYLIEDGINGYLCNNDSEILNKIENIKNDKIMKNSKKIIETSLKYNIINKINDFEDILKSELNYKIINSCIIITSVINCSNDSLSYYNTRSIFSIEERFNQTMISIKSIKYKMSDCEIIFCECSDLSENKNIEEAIKKECNYYYNFYNIDIIKESVNSKLKGLGEVNLLINVFNKIIESKIKYKYIFKLSGRYYLNDQFDYSNYDINKNIFSYWDNSISSFCTIFYKINYNDIYLFTNILNKSINDLENGESIEICLYKYFTKNINIFDKLNIDGLLSTEGYKISV